MNRLLALFTVLFVGINVYAQKEAAVWMLGKYSKSLDFNSGQPIPVADGKSNIVFGSASICDTNGKLLFYTDGRTIWNANHQPMKNGDLKGNSWSKQPSIIIPLYKSLYYVFHTQSPGNLPLQIPKPTTYDTTLRYSIVDMEKEEGLGAVIQKDIPLLKPASNCVAAIRHANGVDTWVVTLSNKQEFGGQYDVFYAYLLTTCGIVDTVASNQMLYGSELTNIRIKFSPNGKKIFITAGDDTFNFVDYLLDFNDATGEVSNMKKLCNAVSSQSSSFSPDSKYLYCFLYNQNQVITRYDLSQANICDNKYEINYPISSFTLQCGIDGQLYGVGGSGQDDARLVLLQNSDDVDGENVKPTTVYLGNYISYTFPNFIESYFDPNYRTPSVPMFSTKRVCEGLDARFALNTNQFSKALQNVQWNFGDGSFSSLLSPANAKDTISHVYSKAGRYKVTFYLYFDCMTDSIEREILIDSFPKVELGSDKKICNGTNYELSVPEGYNSYLWNIGSNENTIIVNKAGEYSIEVSNACGIAYDTIRFTERNISIANLITPNGDGKNETLVITGLDELSGQLSVFDRWGIKVYENRSYDNDWDNNQQEGMYFYNFKLDSCPDYNGWVQVIK